MIAATTTDAGGDVLVGEVDVPEQRPGSVIVQVRTALVDGFDRAIYRGRRGARFPLIQGSAGAGTLKTGGGSLVVGSKVVVWPHVECRRCPSCRSGRPERCVSVTVIGLDLPGLLAEQVAVPRTAVVRLAEGIGPAIATMGVRYADAWRLLHEAGGEIDGARVLVIGSGAAAARVAKLAGLLGAEVTSSTDLDGEHRRFDLVVVVTAIDGLRAEVLAPGGALILAPEADAATGALQPGVIAQRATRIIGSRPATQRDLVHFFRWLKTVDWPQETAHVVPLDDVARHLAADDDVATIVTI